MTDYERELLSSLVTLNAQIKDLADNNPEVTKALNLQRLYNCNELALKDSMGEAEYNKMFAGFRAMFAPKQ